MTKNFNYGSTRFSFSDPSEIEFENTVYGDIYEKLYDRISSGEPSPIIDFDELSEEIDLLCIVNSSEVRIRQEYKESNQKALLYFLEKYPEFYLFIKNANANAKVEVDSIEFLLGNSVGAGNFIEAKRLIDLWNKTRWTRPKTISERQGGVSILGNISETLLERAFMSFVDDTNFFRNNTSSVQSYGDFVLMSLPNNLWLSVKSNFARERLLASGFTTDIIGVGFFTDSTEFTSGAKIRNFQKVGFLAMYVPDIAMTEEQKEANMSTFHEIENYYQSQDLPMPLNINGKPFIRKLSEIKEDLNVLVQIEDVRNRTTIGF